MNKLKKPWVKPEVTTLRPTRELIGLFAPRAVAQIAGEDEPSEVTGHSQKT